MPPLATPDALFFAADIAFAAAAITLMPPLLPRHMLIAATAPRFAFRH